DCSHIPCLEVFLRKVGCQNHVGEKFKRHSSPRIHRDESWHEARGGSSCAWHGGDCYGMSSSLRPLPARALRRAWAIRWRKRGSFSSSNSKRSSSSAKPMRA